MITLTNNAIIEDLYSILNLTNNPSFWIYSDYTGKLALAVNNGENEETLYTYSDKVALENDYSELTRLQKLLKDNKN